jgi:cytochrome c-type biogenesis protein CcmH/NrfG
MRLLAVALLAFVTEVVGADPRVRPGVEKWVGPYTDGVTYSRDIAPLIADRCAMCHHPGGSGPFSLLTFDDVKRRAALIAAVTERRYMPPWKADPANGPFVGQHPLTSDEIKRIRRWVDEGAVEGDRRAVPAAPTWTEGWQIGKPDLVVTLPQPYTLAPDGTDAFHIFVLPIPTTAVRFVRALEIRPGNPQVVHHANIRIDKTPASRRLDEAQPGPGYDGLIAHSAQYPDGHFLGWTPGQVAPLLPPDLAWRLETHSDLVVELHMRPSGKPESVAPSIGLYFSEAVPSRTPAMLRLGRQSIDIPAGDKEYTITDSFVVPVDVDVQAVQPHAHYRARNVRGDATLPDGTVQPLIAIADWDFRWQHVYRFVAPRHLPKGTRLSMQYTYDNSAENPRNPDQPPKRARWGQRSSDEMGDLWIQVLTKDTADLDRLVAAFRPKVLAEDILGYEVEIEKHPGDAALHDDAALLNLELGRADAAVRHFSASLALKPDSAPAHYNLGTALTVAKRLDDAAAEYRRALQIDPGYANAYNNLGSVLLSQRRFADAIAAYREVVRLQPAAATGFANLAAAYAATGQFEQAVEAIDVALRLSPPEPSAGELRRLRAMYLQRR